MSELGRIEVEAVTERVIVEGRGRAEDAGVNQLMMWLHVLRAFT